MAKISHYVVTYNHDTGKFENDDASIEVHFPDGFIWDDKELTWKFSDDSDYDGDVLGEEFLYEMINQFNTSLGG